jgi:hypothetical protein
MSGWVRVDVCNGDHTCPWCRDEIADETNNDTEQGDNE